MPKATEQQVDHKAEALRLLALHTPKGTPTPDYGAAFVHSNLAIAEGQERVGEELKRLVEGVAFGLRDELQQVFSEIVVAVKEGQS